MATTKAKYSDIYQAIKQRILSGEYSTTEKLPGGSEFAEEFGCSELTIKKSTGYLGNGRLGRAQTWLWLFCKKTIR